MLGLAALFCGYLRLLGSLLLVVVCYLILLLGFTCCISLLGDCFGLIVVLIALCIAICVDLGCLYVVCLVVCFGVNLGFSACDVGWFGILILLDLF